MGDLRRRRRWAGAVAALVLAGCGGGGAAGEGAGGATTTAASDTTTTSEPTTTTGSTTTTHPDDGLAAAPPLDVSAAGVCDQLAATDLGAVLSRPVTAAAPQAGAEPGCAFASDLTGDGAIQPDTAALLAVAEVPARPQDESVAGEAARGLPTLEGLERLGPSVGATAFRTRNEYLDTWEAFAFVATEDELVRIHLRDPAWTAEEEALDAAVGLLEDLGAVG